MFIFFDNFQFQDQVISTQNMQIESNNHTILQFVSQPGTKANSRQNQDNYFQKHWQVIQTSIKFFLVEKASVNLVAFKKSLQLLVLRNNVKRIKEGLVNIWSQVFVQILSLIQKEQSNPLISLIQHYKIIQNRLKIVFTLLKSYLRLGDQDKTDGIDQFGKLVIHQRETVQKTAFDILCRIILQSRLRALYEKQMILLIDAFRNSSYSSQSVLSEEACKTQVRVDLLIVKKIGLFRHLQTQFDESSKNFYVQLSEQIPKDQNFLFIVNEYLQRQIDLNQIFQPQQNTVYYVEKQLIREQYDFILDNLLEQIINRNDKKSLKIFWKFTLRLKEDAMKKFSSKLKKIILSIKKYLTNISNPKQDVFKIVEFRQNLFNLTQQCFEKNRKISNIIYNTFQQALYEQEKNFLHISLKNILHQDTTFIKSKMIIQGTQLKCESFDHSNYFKLFGIAPSKQNFIKQFENRFSKWILQKGFQLKTLKMQQKMITQMKKQVGNNLMKNLDKMLNDVWRNDAMHFQQKTMKNGTHIKCLFLSKHWPVQLSIVFNIPDQLYNLLNDFEHEFKSQIQNREKSIRWISQMGTVKLLIHGIKSIFSEIEASIIMLLDKSIRPLKRQQIQASLNICNMNQSTQGFSAEKYLFQILINLVKNNILSFNPGPQTYDINDDNKLCYKFQKSGDQREMSSIKKVNVERDYSILIQAAIVKILKKRKNMQRTDITRFIEETIKYFKPSFEQITKAFEKLHNSQYIQINRAKGIISYVE